MTSLEERERERILIQNADLHVRHMGLSYGCLENRIYPTDNHGSKAKFDYRSQIRLS